MSFDNSNLYEEYKQVLSDNMTSLIIDCLELLIEKNKSNENFNDNVFIEYLKINLKKSGDEKTSLVKFLDSTKTDIEKTIDSFQKLAEKADGAIYKISNKNEVFEKLYAICYEANNKLVELKNQTELTKFAIDASNTMVETKKNETLNNFDNLKNVINGLNKIENKKDSENNSNTNGSKKPRPKEIRTKDPLKLPFYLMAILYISILLGSVLVLTGLNYKNILAVIKSTSKTENENTEVEKNGKNNNVFISDIKNELEKHSKSIEKVSGIINNIIKIIESKQESEPLEVKLNNALNKSSLVLSIENLKTTINNAIIEKDKYDAEKKSLIVDINRKGQEIKSLVDKIKDFEKKRIIDKSLLVVFIASTELHLTKEISSALNELFKNEFQSRESGFYRAFSVIRERKLSSKVQFDKPYQPGTIDKEIANGDAVNLNTPDVLKKIKDESLKSTKANKEILILVGAEGIPPNLDDPSSSVFKDRIQTVNIVLVLNSGSFPSKSSYDKWIKWAYNNNATITWINNDGENKIDGQIITILKKAMGKDMGF